jgi:hypothetical protein
LYEHLNEEKMSDAHRASGDVLGLASVMEKLNDKSKYEFTSGKIALMDMVAKPISSVFSQFDGEREAIQSTALSQLCKHFDLHDVMWSVFKRDQIKGHLSKDKCMYGRTFKTNGDTIVFSVETIDSYNAKARKLRHASEAKVVEKILETLGGKKGGAVEEVKSSSSSKRNGTEASRVGNEFQEDTPVDTTTETIVKGMRDEEERKKNELVEKLRELPEGSTPVGADTGLHNTIAAARGNQMKGDTFKEGGLDRDTYRYVENPSLITVISSKSITDGSGTPQREERKQKALKKHAKKYPAFAKATEKIAKFSTKTVVLGKLIEAATVSVVNAKCLSAFYAKKEWGRDRMNNRAGIRREIARAVTAILPNKSDVLIYGADYNKSVIPGAAQGESLVDKFIRKAGETNTCIQMGEHRTSTLDSNSWQYMPHPVGQESFKAIAERKAREERKNTKKAEEVVSSDRDIPKVDEDDEMKGSNDPGNSSSSSSGDTEVRQEDGRTAGGGREGRGSRRELSFLAR